MRPLNKAPRGLVTFYDINCDECNINDLNDITCIVAHCSFLKVLYSLMMAN